MHYVVTLMTQSFIEMSGKLPTLVFYQHSLASVHICFDVHQVLSLHRKLISVVTCRHHMQ